MVGLIVHVFMRASLPLRQLTINNPPRLRRFFVSAQTISRGAKHMDVQVSLEAGCWLRP